MKQQNELQFVIELLTRWLAKIHLNTALKHYDINLISEDLSIKILNTLYGYKLKNLNSIKDNYPGIDLGDAKEGKIAFQVTSRIDGAKIKENLITFVEKEYDKIYTNGIYFLILNIGKMKIGNQKFQKILPSFDKKKHIITSEILIQEIEKIYNSNEDIFKEIKNILANEFDTHVIDIDLKSFFRLNHSVIQSKNKARLDIIEKLCIPKYLNSQREKYKDIKTFLNTEKQPFYNLYFPVFLKKQEISHSYFSDSLFEPSNKTKQKINLVNIANVFNESHCVSILGTAGSGKSTLVNHLFLNTINNYYGIPIIIELRNLNNFEGSLTEYICKSSFFNQIEPNEPAFNEFLKLGKIVFFFDGFDELYSTKKQNRILEIEGFIDSYYENKFIMTSRPGTGIELFRRFENMQVLPLSNAEINVFVEQQVKNEELRKNIIQSIQQEKNSNFIPYLKTPLLLSMYILNYNLHPEVPDKKSKFYSNVFDTLYQRHDGESKFGFPREKLSNLTQDEFEIILRIFSYHSFFNGKYSFDVQYLKSVLKKIKHTLKLSFEDNKLIKDLQVALSILIKEGTEYKFPHRSLQEYFTALFIKELKPSAKEKVYSKKFKKLSIHTSNISAHLLELCKETDQYHYSKYFLLPKISQVLKNYKSDNDSNKFISIIDFFGIQIQYKQFEPLDTVSPSSYVQNKYNGLGLLFQEIGLLKDYLAPFTDFENKEYPKVLTYLKETNCQDFLSRDFLLDDKEVLYSLNMFEKKANPLFQQLLLDIGLFSEINQFYIDLKNVKLELEKKLTNLLEIEDDMVDWI